MAPQEQVAARQAPDRVQFQEGQDQSGGDPHGPDLLMEQFFPHAAANPRGLCLYDLLATYVYSLF